MKAKITLQDIAIEGNTRHTPGQVIEENTEVTDDIEYALLMVRRTTEDAADGQIYYFTTIANIEYESDAEQLQAAAEEALVMFLDSARYVGPEYCQDEEGNYRDSVPVEDWVFTITSERL